jgi:alkyl hydroperoxide reductase subunit AhpF
MFAVLKSCRQVYIIQTKADATFLPAGHPKKDTSSSFGANMEKLLNQEVTGQIQQAFDALEQPVQILFFGSQSDCEYCAETLQLLTEVSEQHEKVFLSIHDLQNDAELAAKLQVNKAPAIVIAGKDGDTTLDLGIQFSGIPSGYEFSTLVNDILLASKRDSGLSAETREYLKSLKQPLLMQVFVTPT